MRFAFPRPLARQSRTLRSLDAVVPFEVDHMSGHCHYAEKLSMYAIGRCKGYSEIGIETTWTAVSICANDARVKIGDDLSNVLCDLSVNICCELAKRNLSLTHALPRRQTLLVSETHAQTFIDTLRRDYDIYKTLHTVDFPGKELLLARSCFELTPVKHLLALLEAEGWTATARLVGSTIAELSLGKRLRCLGLRTLLGGRRLGPQADPLSWRFACAQDSPLRSLGRHWPA